MNDDVERRYAEALKRGEVMAVDLVENPDGSISLQYAGRVDPAREEEQQKQHDDAGM